MAKVTLNKNVLAIELCSIETNKLLAIERSFVDMISIGKKGMRRLLEKKAPKIEIEALSDSIDSRISAHKMITNELLFRNELEFEKVSFSDMKFSNEPLPIGVG